MKKLFFLRDRTFEKGIHRDGWDAATNRLSELLHDTNSDIAFDDFCEISFLKKDEGIYPYEFNWIGVLHIPTAVGYPYNPKSSLAAMLCDSKFKDSLKSCKGLYTLSKSLKREADILLDSKVNIEVLNLSTALDVKQFDLSRYKLNQKIINLGWWLRKMESFYFLNVDIPKFFLIGKSKWAQGQLALAKEDYKKLSNILNKQIKNDAHVLPFLDNSQYDDILSESICFADFMSSSANNAIVECIARSTPILVNPLPSIVEYLGEEYPFYYLTLEEAERKAKDIDLIEKTSIYLSKMDKKFISHEHFVNSFLASDIYKNL